jgi:Spy/CpxP family protein refolding chaperone
MEISKTSERKPPKPTMKNQLVKLLPLLTIAIAAPVFAAPNYFNHNHNTPHGQIANREMGRRADRLNLTSAQKTKIEQLRAATRSQMDAVLTLEQRQKFAQINARRQARQQGAKGMNLTSAQKTKLKALRAANQAEYQAILTPTQQAQLTQGGGWRRGGSMARLNLTPDQKAKIQQLRASARSQRDAVLTPAQQQQAKANHQQHQAMGNTWNLNLTPEQQAQINRIRQANEQQLNAILTPEQQAKRQSHHRHGGRHKSV